MTAGDWADMEAVFVVDQVIRLVADNEELWESHELERLAPEDRYELVRDILVDLMEWFEICEEPDGAEPA